MVTVFWICSESHSQRLGKAKENRESKTAFKNATEDIKSEQVLPWESLVKLRNEERIQSVVSAPVSFEIAMKLIHHVTTNK